MGEETKESMDPRILTVEVLRNGNLMHLALELDYSGRDKSVDLVQLMRNRLVDQAINIQVHTSDERPQKEVNWQRIALQLENTTPKTSLDALRNQNKYIIINTTYRYGPAYHDRCCV